MKCIHCGTDSKLKERTAGRCKDCSHRFAFEPTKDPRRITDGAFKATIDAVSGKGAHFFTERQLWYELNRRVLRKRFWRQPWGAVAGISTVGAIFVGVVSAGALAAPAFVVGISGLAFGALMSRNAKNRGVKRPVVDHSTYRVVYLEPWTAVHGALEKMVPFGQAPPTEPQKVPPDVTQYSVDRALVVEDAQTAAMLVANRFHFENNCAILSKDGYPFGSITIEGGSAASLRETVMEMLRRNPKLQVYVVHSASGAGAMLASQMRDHAWFPEQSVRVIDLGLRPTDALKMGLISLEGSYVQLSESVRSALKPEEAKWLEEGNSAELATLRPAKLMRAVYQGFARAGQIGADGSTGGADGGPIFIWGYDGGADIYAADSFG
jgi:DNA-directed RNA polymerase subunit RPC12/RpoP